MIALDSIMQTWATLVCNYHLKLEAARFNLSQKNMNKLCELQLLRLGEILVFEDVGQAFKTV